MQIERRTDFESSFIDVQSLHPNVTRITCAICGVRIEEIDIPLMQRIRYTDKLVTSSRGKANGEDPAQVIRQSRLAYSIHVAQQEVPSWTLRSPPPGIKP